METTIHIGTGKTGTSSIQLFLHGNRNILADNGVLYTKSLGLTNNIEIAKYGLDSNEFSKSFFFKNLGIQTTEEKNKFDKEVVKKLSIEINDAKRKGIKKAIISSEHFATDLRNVQNIKKIKGLFDTVGINVNTIIIYIREQASYVFSDYNTRILMGEYRNVTPHTPVSVTNSVLNHAHTIKIWSDSFVDAKVKIRIFEKEKLKNGNSVDDFINLTDLSEISALKRMQSNNESLSKNALVFLMKYNQYVESHSLQSQLSITNPNIRNNLIKLCRKNFPGNTLKPTKKIRDDMRNLFKSSNEEVRRKYFSSSSDLFVYNKSVSEDKEFKLEKSEIILMDSLLIKLLEN